MKRVRVAVLMLTAVGTVLTVAPRPAYAQAIPVYAESAGDALARNVKLLASSPKNLNALLGAGKAALDLGDPQSAAGFFARAGEVSPNSPAVQAGIGASLVATGDPQNALTYFERAQQLGGSATMFGCHRGMAFDLLGQQALAQKDYRAALFGPDRDEAQRRLALSQAIAGNKDAALATLQPLLQRRDLGATRVRSLVLAVAGDLVGAKAALDAMMPGASARMEPFFRRLPYLTAEQKAAAVHLGEFNEVGVAGSASQAEGLASIEQLLQAQPQVASAPPVAAAIPQPQIFQQQPQPRPTQMAALSRPVLSPSSDDSPIETARVQSDPGSRKIWLQLASGASSAALPLEFRRIRSASPELFNDISGYVAEDGQRARLLIGPFHSHEDARLFEDALASERITASAWTSRPGQPVRKLD